MGSRHLHTKNQLARMRATSGLTQAELAARAGVTRQAIGGIEAGRHATTVEIGLRLARALGCRVEDIFGLAPGPGRERAIAPLSEVTTGPMRVALSRVGDQLVARPLRQLGDHRLATVAADAMATSLGGDGAPIGATDAHRQADDRGWPDDELEPADHGDGQIRSVRVDRFAPPGVGAARPCLFLVGCDPALGLLASHVSRRPGTGGALWFQANNSAASRQLGAGLAHVAGVHAPPVDARPGVGGDGGWATIRMCSWEMGWALRPTGPGHAANEPVVSLLTDGGHRVANRESGSGARALLDRLLVEHDMSPTEVDGYGWELDGHTEVAEAIVQGRAHTGIIPRPVAQAWGLDFVPVEEQFCDLFTTVDLLNTETMARLIDTLGSAAFKADLAASGPYDTRHTAEIL